MLANFAMFFLHQMAGQASNMTPGRNGQHVTDADRELVRDPSRCDKGQKGSPLGDGGLPEAMDGEQNSLIAPFNEHVFEMLGNMQQYW